MPIAVPLSEFRIGSVPQQMSRRKIIPLAGWAYAGVRTTRRRSELPVWRLIGILLVLWLVVTVVGAVVKGLFWLAVVGGLFFLVTAAIGAGKRRTELPGSRR
jgi:hypothetical protein